MSDQIMALISKWLMTDTHDRMTGRQVPNTSANSVCLSVLPVADTYCRAIMELVDQNYKLPAMALLRVLIELMLKVCWCLDRTSEEDTESKIQSWYKNSLKQRRNWLKGMAEGELAAEEWRDAYEKEIEAMDEVIEEIHQKPIPPFGALVKDLPGRCRDIYRVVYKQALQGIHPDLLVLMDTVKQDGDELVSIGDIHSVAEKDLQGHCLYMALRLACWVRTYQGWECREMEDEAEVVLRRLGERKVE